MVRFRKNEQFEHLGHSQPQLERFLGGAQLLFSKSLHNDGSVAKVCESLVGLTGGVPKICFGVADVARQKIFIVPVVRAPSVRAFSKIFWTGIRWALSAGSLGIRVETALELLLLQPV